MRRQDKKLFCRKENSKSKRKVIGKHGLYALEQTRTETKRLLILMDEGIDATPLLSNMPPDNCNVQKRYSLNCTIHSDIYRYRRILVKPIFSPIRSRLEFTTSVCL